MWACVTGRTLTLRNPHIPLLLGLELPSVRAALDSVIKDIKEESNMRRITDPIDINGMKHIYTAVFPLHFLSSFLNLDI